MNFAKCPESRFAYITLTFQETLLDYIIYNKLPTEIYNDSWQ
jgi:hypothetical protein